MRAIGSTFPIEAENVSCNRFRRRQCRDRAGAQRFAAGDDVVVLLSGLGATPIIELYVLFADVAEIMKERGVAIRHSFVGNFFTSLEIKGATLTVMKLDAELNGENLVVDGGYTIR